MFRFFCDGENHTHDTNGNVPHQHFISKKLLANGPSHILDDNLKMNSQSFFFYYYYLEKNKITITIDGEPLRVDT